MKKLIIALIGLFSIFSCQEPDDFQLTKDCEVSSEIVAPKGFEINLLKTIQFNGNLMEVQFIDETTGYILGGNNVGGYADVFKTIDGGRTWKNMEIASREVPRNMFFLNEQVGFISFYGSNGNLLKTTDGGKSWDKLSYSDLNGMMYHMQKDSEDNIYSIITDLNSETLLLKSSDTAQTWQVINDSPDLDFDLVTFSFKIFDDTLYIAGADGKLIITDIHGNQQNMIQTGLTSFKDVHVVDGDNLVITGSAKTIKSSDGGLNWIDIYERSSRIINFNNPEAGMMILNKSYCPSDVYQSNDVLAFTDDGGGSWVESLPVTNMISRYSDHVILSPNRYLILFGNSLYELIHRKPSN